MTGLHFDNDPPKRAKYNVIKVMEGIEIDKAISNIKLHLSYIII